MKRQGVSMTAILFATTAANATFPDALVVKEMRYAPIKTSEVTRLAVRWFLSLTFSPSLSAAASDIDWQIYAPVNESATTIPRNELINESEISAMARCSSGVTAFPIAEKYFSV